MNRISIRFLTAGFLLGVLLILAPPVQAQKAGKTNSDDLVFVEVEKMPEFPGGTNALLAYIGSQVVIPAELKKQGLEGLAVLSFVVDKKGKINSIEVLKSIHPDMDQEIIKVIQKMPKWTPGQQNGKNVNVKFTIPVRLKST